MKRSPRERDPPCSGRNDGQGEGHASELDSASSQNAGNRTLGAPGRAPPMAAPRRSPTPARRTSALCKGHSCRGATSTTKARRAPRVIAVRAKSTAPVPVTRGRRSLNAGRDRAAEHQSRRELDRSPPQRGGAERVRSGVTPSVIRPEPQVCGDAQSGDRRRDDASTPRRGLSGSGGPRGRRARGCAGPPTTLVAVATTPATADAPTDLASPRQIERGDGSRREQ